jgi:hypothetical protein
MDSLTPGTIVGPPSLHDPARNIRFGVVQAPPPSDRVKRITSDDPQEWQSAIAETVEAVWPAAIHDRLAAERIEAQVNRWGLRRDGQPGYMKRRSDPSKPEGYRLDWEPLSPEQLRSGLWVLDVPGEDEEVREHRGQFASADDELEAL